MTLEIIHQSGRGDGRPPLLFIHGSFSAAWVWQEHFLPYFAERGWECAALSLSGHGSSRLERRLDSLGLQDYVADVEEVAVGLGRPPVVIGHSLGGAVAQRFATHHRSAGQILLSPVPPGGFAGVALWMGIHQPRFLWQLGLIEAGGGSHVDPALLAGRLFSPETPPDDANRFLARMQRESRRALADVMLPLHVWRPAVEFPTLVLGGDDDVFIPQSSLHATAAHWHGQLVVQPGIPHVMMLDAHWRRPAEAIAAWLDARFPVSA